MGRAAERSAQEPKAESNVLSDLSFAAAGQEGEPWYFCWRNKEISGIFIFLGDSQSGFHGV